MKVLFSNPPWWEGQEISECNGQRLKYWVSGVRAGSRWPHSLPIGGSPGEFFLGDYLPYPFFMAYATTYLAKHAGVIVNFRDSIALRESYPDYFRFLEDNLFDYIFIESATPSWETDKRIILEIKRRFPFTKIVITGPITVKAKELLEQYPIHACIRGEYEKGAVKVINGGEGIIDFDLLTQDEMNQSPIFYNDRIYAHRYWDAKPKGQQYPQLQVWSSRGCPFKCIFCVWPATMTGNDPDGKGKRTVRYYSPEYMEAMLDELVRKYGYKSVYFDDDTFNLGDKHVLGMCEVMRKIGLPWSAMCRADTISKDTWKEMKESGCFGVKLGFESGNQYVLDNIVNKRLNLEKARETALYIKGLGLTVHGTFTYGLPGESLAQMQDTKHYIASIPFDSIQESGTAEIDGTPLHSLVEKGSLERYEGAKIEGDYLKFSDGNKKIQFMAGQKIKNQSHKGKRLFYCDATLFNNKGHYANTCRLIRKAAIQGNYDLKVFANINIYPELQNELEARPHFRQIPYMHLNPDPVCRELAGFSSIVKETIEDLDGLGWLDSSDVLYWNSMQPPIIKALAEWAQSRFKPENCPRIVGEFGDWPYLEHNNDEINLIGPNAAFYRWASKEIKAEYAHRFEFVTFDESSSRDYAYLLERNVATYPLPREAVTNCRNRSFDDPLLIGFIGHQRRDKGYQLLPDIIFGLLKSEQNIRIIVQNVGLKEQEETNQQIAELANQFPSRLEFILAPADATAWAELLDKVSLLVLPYDPVRYANSYSAIAAEAIANAIPQIVPKGSSMERLLKEFGNPGLSFEEWTVTSIQEAILKGIENFSFLALRGVQASRIWERSHGGAKLLARIMGAEQNLLVN